MLEEILFPVRRRERMIRKSFRLEDFDDLERFLKEYICPKYLDSISEIQCSFPENLDYVIYRGRGYGEIYEKFIPTVNLKKNLVLLTSSEIEDAIKLMLKSLTQIHYYGDRRFRKDKNRMISGKNIRPMRFSELIGEFDFAKDLEKRFINRVNPNVDKRLINDLIENYKDNESIEGLFRLLPKDFCHLDPHLENWILAEQDDDILSLLRNFIGEEENKKLYLLDWEKAARAPGIYDLPFILEDAEIQNHNISKEELIKFYLDEKERLSGREFTETERNLNMLAYYFASVHANLCYIGKIVSEKPSQKKELPYLIANVKTKLRAFAKEGILQEFYYSLERYFEKSGLYELAKPTRIESPIDEVFSKFLGYLSEDPVLKSLLPKDFQ